MADIFVSYSHQDGERAREIATAIEAQGWSVWWDPAIRSGESFVSLINREISEASCVVVLWSKASVGSRWVLEEAHNGLNRGILCPVVIDRDVQLPVGFATIKYLPLWNWRKGAPAGGFNPLFSELVRVLGVPVRAAPNLQPAESAAELPPVEERRPEPSARPPRAGVKRAERQPEARRQEPAPPPAPTQPTKDRFIDFSDVSWIDYPIVALFFVPIALLLLDFGGRYFFNTVFAFTYDLIEMTGGAAALFGAAIAVRNSKSIRSPASLLLFGGVLNKRLSAAQALVSCGVFSAVASAIVSRAAQSLAMGEVSVQTVAAIPLAPFRFALALAFALMAIFSLVVFARALSGRHRT